ncbi:unnamed protein product [Lepeophtheirus salmonis]|uniref:(salmon louse) hypothetical protein n=1 Tax=Lepeophtheirus salmonis TaxID=72036 RepID=A0A7R8H2I4_LEPSM|nr:unnamed protein product [Lepeophtheirus salmonis]CAF2828979.1 unnamed protein product [Lepeophtheirus salmonis]
MSELVRETAWDYLMHLSQSVRIDADFEQSCRQDDPLAQCLFIISLDQLMVFLQRIKDISMENLSHKIEVYADYMTTLYSSSASEIQSSVDETINIIEASQLHWAAEPSMDGRFEIVPSMDGHYKSITADVFRVKKRLHDHHDMTTKPNRDRAKKLDSNEVKEVFQANPNTPMSYFAKDHLSASL